LIVHRTTFHPSNVVKCSKLTHRTSIILG